MYRTTFVILIIATREFFKKILFLGISDNSDISNYPNGRERKKKRTLGSKWRDHNKDEIIHKRDNLTNITV